MIAGSGVGREGVLHIRLVTCNICEICDEIGTSHGPWHEMSMASGICYESISLIMHKTTIDYGKKELIDLKRL